ncbi:MAG: hypothetical protein WAN61_02355 [Minisyncoccia bacterium]
MKNETEKTYSIEEVKESLSQYLDASVDRLRLRLKSAWKKQIYIKHPLYDKAEV